MKEAKEDVMQWMIDQIMLESDKNDRLLAEAFLELPSREDYPDYYDTIIEPIALDIIQAKLDEGRYTSVRDLADDFKLMVENATKFNRKGSPVYKDAVQLMDRFETLLAESEVKFLEEEKLETHENKLSEIEWNGITYKIGDYCYFEAGGDQRLVGCLFDMWQDESGRKGVTVHMYVFPEMTHHKFQTKFYQKEVLKRTRPEHRFVESILGRCHVLHVKDYVRGKPVGADMNDVYVCENRYNDQTRTISKIKNWAICVPEQVRTQDLILDLYDQPLHLQKAPLASELGEQPPYKRRKDSEDFDSPLQKRRATLTRVARLMVGSGRITLDSQCQQSRSNCIDDSHHRRQPSSCHGL
ncbi:hypothetical protein EDD86DRAFT_214677 [Gorgonomyces haynaldii]|nr:hypothetical protein EDD86DRAFT_214677 [Gorgonomyces haynaldii]